MSRIKLPLPSLAFDTPYCATADVVNATVQTIAIAIFMIFPLGLRFLVSTIDQEITCTSFFWINCTKCAVERLCRRKTLTAPNEPFVRQCPIRNQKNDGRRWQIILIPPDSLITYPATRSAPSKRGKLPTGLRPSIQMRISGADIPLLDDDDGILQRLHHQALVAKLSIEGFSQYPYSDGLPSSMYSVFAPSFAKPVAHDLGRHLGAVVRYDVLRYASGDRNVGHRFDDPQLSIRLATQMARYSWMKSSISRTSAAACVRRGFAPRGTHGSEHDRDAAAVDGYRVSAKLRPFRPCGSTA